MKLTKYFEEATDFRVKGRCLHDLAEILFLILLGTLCDCDDFSEIRDWGNDELPFLRNDLDLKYTNGIPSEDTLERVMKHLNPKELEVVMRKTASEIVSCLSGKQFCVDGKEHRGTIPSGQKHALIRTVSVWIAEEKLCFGQKQIDTKSNEKVAIPSLLETLDIKGGIVTIDAIACHANIVKVIVDGGADYLIALKKNQGRLYEQIHDWMLSRKTQLPHYEEINKEHGRAEKRKVYIEQDLTLLDATHSWDKLYTIVLVESTRVTPQKKSIENRFYICSLEDNKPKRYLDLSRRHWAVENDLHWQLDLTFHEDNSRIRKGNAPQNMNIVRKLALFILNQNQDKMSLKRKRKKAARDKQFLSSLLNNV
jgi:predicted transposase YbfD/YdcC